MRVYLEDDTIGARFKAFGSMVMAILCVVLGTLTAGLFLHDDGGIGFLLLVVVFSGIYLWLYFKLIDVLKSKTPSSSSDSSSFYDDDDD